MASPTDGAWDWRQSADGQTWTVYALRHGTSHDLAHVFGRTPEERRANARLMAAAPRLADALRDVIAFLEMEPVVMGPRLRRQVEDALEATS